MIIPRKYECFGFLYENDPESKDLFDKAFSHFEIDEDRKAKLIEEERYRIPGLFFDPRVAGTLHHCYWYVADSIDKLDQVKSYDNGLTLKDVTDTEFYHYGEVLQLIFYVREPECPQRIAGFTALVSKNGVVEIERSRDWAVPIHKLTLLY